MQFAELVKKYVRLSMLMKCICGFVKPTSGEPMNGLDKDGVSDMREYLKSFREQGKTILIASHSAEDINTLCDTVCEMDKGVLNNKKCDGVVGG